MLVLVLDDFIVEEADLSISGVDISIELPLHALIMIEHGPAVVGMERLLLALVHYLLGL